MSHLESQPGLMRALSDEMMPKFLATCSADGIPNVVPCTSTMPSGDVPDRLIFGNFLLRKSIGNLDTNPAVGVLVMTTELEGWVLQGQFLGWQQTGPYVDRLNSTDLLRYNPYTGVRNAGIIDVEAVVRQFRISRLRVVTDYLVARAARLRASGQGATTMPPVVREQFSHLTAVRVLAGVDGAGTPWMVPALSLQPAGESTLVCAESLSADVLQPVLGGTPVAANLLTLDVVSFQVKGRWLGSRRVLGAPVGGMAITAVYAGGPPIPGRRVA